MLTIPRRDNGLNDQLEALDEYFVTVPENLPAADRFRRAWDSLPDDAIKFIADEIYKCKYDVRYYLEQYHVITDEEGHYRTLYPFWDHQEIIFDVMKREWEENGTYRLIILKPRQCGGTVWASGVIFHATQFFAGSFSMMMAQGKKTTANIYRRVWDSINHLPWWMRASRESKQQEVHIVFQREGEQERMRDPGLGSTLVISNAQEQAGVAIGKTIKNLHGSECSRWPDDDTWSADIEPSMNAKDTRAFLESTAYGRVGLFWNMWRAAEKGESDWIPVFIPVYRVRKYYTPIKKGEVFTLDSEEKTMREAVTRRESFKVPLGFFKWRRRKRQAYINAQGRDDSFYESYPSTPGEAFINSGDCAFPKKSLNEQERDNCVDPILIGEIGYVSAQDPPDLKLHKPKPEELLEKPDIHNRLWVWEEPTGDEATEYYLGADISSGESTDYTDIAVYRVGYGMEPNTQVAEWHGLINPSYAARVIVALGYWYHTCEVAVEYAVSGITTCNEIQWHLDYPNIYRWRRQDKIGNTVTMHTHWLTNHLTREDMINRMYESLVDRTIKIRNRHLIEEMRDFGRSSFDTRAEAMSGNDDMCFPPGSYVTTGEGDKRIEDIGVGDIVLSHDGLWRVVDAIGDRNVDEDLVGIKVWGVPSSLNCTSNHPVLVRKRRYKQGTSPALFLDPEWANAANINKGDAVFVPAKPPTRPSILTDDQLYLLGWCLADGSVGTNNCVKIVFGKGEMECAQLLRRIIEDLIKIHPTEWMTGVGRKGKHLRYSIVTIRDRGQYIVLSCSSKWLAQWVIRWVGPNRKRRIHKHILNSIDTLPFVVGFLEGDGSQVLPRKALSVSQKNRGVAVGIRSMLLRQGIWCGMNPDLNRDGQTVLNIGVPWVNKLLSVFPGIKFKTVPRKLDHPIARWDGNGFWVTVADTWRTPYKGKVYNMSVVHSHSYTVSEIAVHNCMANMIAICALHQSGKRQEYAEASSVGGGGSRHANLLPQSPHVYAVVDMYGRQIPRPDGSSNFDTEKEAVDYIRSIEKQNNVKLNGAWNVKPIVVNRANTIFSPAWDTSGAEHELATVHGMSPREQMMNPSTVQSYRDFMRVRSAMRAGNAGGAGGSVPPEELVGDGDGQGANVVSSGEDW